MQFHACNSPSSIQNIISWYENERERERERERFITAIKNNNITNCYNYSSPFIMSWTFLISFFHLVYIHFHIHIFVFLHGISIVIFVYVFIFVINASTFVHSIYIYIMIDFTKILHIALIDYTIFTCLAFVCMSHFHFLFIHFCRIFPLSHIKEYLCIFLLLLILLFAWI